MDGWAEDVRIKVERLFRANEPARVEWRIHGAAQRLKALKKPLAIKGPSFAVRGLRQVLSCMKALANPHSSNSNENPWN